MHNSFKISALALFFSLSLAACLQVDHTYTKVAPGLWRAVLELTPHPPMAMGKKDVARVSEDFQPGDLCFNFDVKYTDPTHFYVEIINGDERIRCDSIQFWRTKNSAYDTLIIRFPHYESYIRAVVREKLMEGEFVITSKTNYSIPFKAKQGIGYRFTNMNEPPAADLTGRWQSTFGLLENQPEAAIGEFKQVGNRLLGTFRTESGDYRFLEGTVQGRRFWLSAFDGSHAFLFTGNIHGDTLDGEFLSGIHYRTLWQAQRNDQFDLRSADSLTTLKPGFSGITFAYQTPDGKSVRLPSPELDGKVKIVQIMGSWCPNCLDETEFLVNYFQKNPSPDVKVIGLAWERHHDAAKANAQVARYKKLKNIPYDLVWAGYSSKDSVAARLPTLQNFTAFPTMIIVDKKNVVREIHTGFDGPATSRFAKFQSDFDALIKKLVAEK